MNRKIAGLLATAALMTAPVAANAVAINVYNDSNAVLRGTVTCDSCQVLYYDAAYLFGTVYGETFSGPQGSSEADEAAWLNSVIGTSYTEDDADKTDTNSAENGTWQSTALYLVIKLGRDPEYSVIKNTSGGLFSFSWASNAGTGSGLSHFTAFGGHQVPEPATLGMLGLGLLGLGLGSRRRRA